MKLNSAFPPRKARIEIIPLIDIMFFLLASFMLASLALIHLQSITMELPTATVPAKSKPDLIDLVVKPDGDLYVGDTPYNVVDLQRFLAKRFRTNSNVQVYIKADPASKYGMFIRALDLVRQVGIPNVSCAISLPPTAKQRVSALRSWEDPVIRDSGKDKRWAVNGFRATATRERRI